MPDISLEQSWERVLAWLAAHAPLSYQALGPPATPAELEDAQRGLAVALPAPLLSLLSMTNGSASASPDPELQFASGCLPGGHSLLAAAEIAPRHRMLTEILESSDGSMDGWWWHREWVPFAGHVAADALAIDQRAGSGQGAVGEFMHETDTSFDWAPSLGAFAADLAMALEEQRDYRYFRPHVVHGRLGWDVVVQDG